MKQSISSPSGFTLVELMIVIIIIGVLFAAASSSFNNIKERTEFHASINEIVALFKQIKAKAYTGDNIQTAEGISIKASFDTEKLTVVAFKDINLNGIQESPTPTTGDITLQSLSINARKLQVVSFTGSTTVDSVGYTNGNTFSDLLILFPKGTNTFSLQTGAGSSLLTSTIQFGLLQGQTEQNRKFITIDSLSSLIHATNL